MRPKEWAKRNGFSPATVWKWCREGTMPVPTIKTEGGRYIILDNQEENLPESVVCYARVSSSDQKHDLQRQADRIKAFAISCGFDDIKVVTEIGSGMNAKRKRLDSVLSDKSVTTIIVEHRDRLMRFGFDAVESALSAQGRRIVVVDDSELEDDIVRDMTEVLTSFCARLYGRRSASRRAEAAVKAAESDA